MDSIKMLEDIKNLCHQYNFVGVEFRANQHLHTIKAYGEVFPSPYEGELEGQLKYIKYVCEHENTDICNISYASTIQEAIEKEIIDENGDIF